MLIHGGMMSSGRFHAFLVVGSYWISCISSFWNTTLPGVVAMLTPSSNAFASVIEILSWPLPRSMSSSRLCRPLTRFWPPRRDRLAEHLGIGQREVRRRERVDVLAREEVDLLLRVLVEALDARHRVVHPARGDEVALLDVVEQEVLLPVLVLEALVALRAARRRARPARPASSSSRPATGSCSPTTGSSATRRAARGSTIIFAASSMNALPMPSSSVGSVVPDLALRAAKSPISLALFSAAEASDSASATGSSLRGRRFRVAGVDIVVLVVVVVRAWSGGESAACHRAASVRRDAVAAPEVVEVGDRLAHREEALLQVELAAEQHRHHLRGGHRRAAPPRRPRRSSASRASWCARSCATRSAMPRNGSPCDGSTSVRRAAGPRTRRASRGSARAGRRRARPARR